MFIAYNEEYLQVSKLEITSEMAKDYCKFMNHLMAKVYDLFFQKKPPGVFPEMRQIM